MKIFIGLLILFIIGCSPKKSEDNTPTMDYMVDEGIQFKSYVGVKTSAFDRAAYVVRQMLKHSPEVKQRMIDVGFVIDIIGTHQNITDLPRYAGLKGQKTADGRDVDTGGIRGLGGSDACSVGEENLICSKNQGYSQENILVHEFAHSIKYFISKQLSEQIDQLFLTAQKNKLYPNDIYMMSNSQEYWAVTTQIWLNATARQDNAGINSKSELIQHDPDISLILRQVYGDAEITHLKNCLY